MKNLLFIISFSFLFSSISYGQVDIQPYTVGINVMNSISELGINNVGDTETTLYVESDYSGFISRGIYAKAFPITNFSGSTYAIVGDANVGDEGTFSYGVQGSAVRTIVSNNGRSIGVFGVAGNATPGANYGVFGRLIGTNNGTAVLGFDNITQNSWDPVLPSNVSYAGYFRGKGYFHNHVGIGQEDPQASLHIKGGNIYVEDNVNGVILRSPDNSCWIISVDNAGVVSSSSTTCP